MFQGHPDDDTKPNEITMLLTFLLAGECDGVVLSGLLLIILSHTHTHTCTALVYTCIDVEMHIKYTTHHVHAAVDTTY